MTAILHLSPKPARRRRRAPQAQPATHVTIQTRYGPLPVHCNWLQSKAAIKRPYTRVRNRT